MATIVRANERSLLVDNLGAVFTNFNIYPHQWRQIFKSYPSKKAVEYDMEMMGLPEADIKPEADAAIEGSMSQGYQTSYVHQTYAIRFSMSHEAIEDNLYDAQWPKDALQLRISLESLQNKVAMHIFNHAFDAGSTVADGQPMCSTMHPYLNGVWANTFNNGIGLNESALEDAITIIKGLPSLAGLPIDTNAVRLLVPQSLAFQASRILDSKFQTGTGNNDINAIQYNKYIPDGYLVNNFLDYPDNWFILTDEQHGFKHYEREKIKFDFETDINTNNLTGRAYRRESFGTSNPRSVFGSGVGVVPQ